MPPRHRPRRAQSDTTHVSDSEPEREAYRQNKTPFESPLPLYPSTPDTTPTKRMPLSALSNTAVGPEPSPWHALNDRLSSIEGGLAEIKTELYAQVSQSSFCEGSTPSTPPSKRARTMHNQANAKRTDPAFRNFNLCLREYIASHHPLHQVRLEQQIQIEQCKVIYVEYQSKVDWRSARDILRCNSNFNHAPRFDCVIYETDDEPIAIGELKFVFRCHLPGNTALDLAMVHPFRKTSWQPNTRTDCPIREKIPTPTFKFIALEHVVRGALLCPIFGGKTGMHYIIDCVDEDMYLRINNID
ncbi:hypothetical protein DFH06DRAFT_1335954 [Mycena polygramma]|nr:hypothetical protein DFH06DRAFT_1335954 [Mycena polygramma]